MKQLKTTNSDIILFDPIIYKDDRGIFSEIFKLDFIKSLNPLINFTQDNLSISKYGVLRGLHWQAEPVGQTKLVTVIKGKIIDFIMDIKSNENETLYFVELSEHNRRQLLIPPGYAHGFISLEDNTIVQYKVDQPYSPNYERCINILEALDSQNFLDKIELQKKKVLQSEKDRNAITKQSINLKPLL